MTHNAPMRAPVEPLVLVCAGKATSGTTFLVMWLTVRPAYGFIFMLDVMNILMMAIPFMLMKKSASAPLSAPIPASRTA